MHDGSTEQVNIAIDGIPEKMEQRGGRVVSAGRCVASSRRRSGLGSIHINDDVQTVCRELRFSIKKAINLLSHDHHENWFAFYDRGEAPFNHIRSWVDRLVKKGNEAAVGASILCNSHLDGATKVDGIPAGEKRVNEISGSPASSYCFCIFIF